MSGTSGKDGAGRRQDLDGRAESEHTLEKTDAALPNIHTGSVDQYDPHAAAEPQDSETAPGGADSAPNQSRASEPRPDAPDNLPPSVPEGAEPIPEAGIWSDSDIANALGLYLQAGGPRFDDEAVKLDAPDEGVAPASPVFGARETVAADGAAAPAVATAALAVEVTPVADAPSLTLADAAGSEDQPLALEIAAVSPDAVAVTIAGLPEGAALSAGTDNGDGSWTLEPAELQGLTLTPPADFAGRFELAVTAVATDGADTALAAGTIAVAIAPVADAPSLSVAPAAGAEDQPIALEIQAAATDADGSETLSIAISGLPEGAALSAGTDNGDGSWTLDPAELQGLTLTPPAEFAGRFELTVETVAADGAAAPAVATAALAVEVTPVADAPSLTLADAAGSEDQPLALEIAAVSPDAVAVTIAGLPEGAALSAGTDNGDGSWTLEPAELQGLTLTPPADFAGRFELAVTAVATDGADTALAAGTIAVAIAPVADAPSLSVAPAAGAEDQPIALEIQAAATDADGSETLSIAISGLPEGAALSAGTDNGDGSWTLDPAELQGLTLTPPAEFAGRFELTVETVAADGAAAPAVATAALAVEVTPVADAPSLTLADAAGSEDQPLALEIAAVSPDAVAVTIAGLPEGAALSAGTDNGDGSWTLEPAELQGLTLTPPADFAGRFELAVTAVATDGADTALAAGTIAVAIAPVADAPSLSVAPAAGAEDQPIALEIQAAATDADGSETLSIAISGLPEGAALSAGTDNGDGSWTLDPAELQGLTLTPPAEFAGRFELTVETVAADGAAAPAVATAALAVEVTPVADAPSLTLADAAGSEDQPLALEIAAVSPDAVAVTIAGLPEGAALSAGTDNGDGSWTLEPAELQGLTLTPPADFAGRFELAVTAVATDGADTALAAGTIAVAIAPVADAPSLSVAPAAGAEDQPIALEIQAAATDADGSETLSIAISGLPEGAALSAGTDNGDGSWTLDPAELQGLTLTPPAEFAGRFELTVETVAADGAAAPAVATAALAVEVTPVADAPSLTLADAAGSEDQPLALEIAAVSPDAVAVTIAGLPEGAALSAGTDNGDGSWTLEPAELQGLTLTPPADFAGRFELAVTAVATDGADTALAAGTIAVAIAPVADAPSLSVAPAAGAEDQPIALEIQAAATDADGSETLSIAISGLPEGAALSAGTDNGDGSWTLDPAELQGLTLTPPAEFAGRFELTVETVAADGAAAPAVATAALAVEVTPVADAPSLTLADAAGSEDQPLALEIAAVSPDAVAVTIAGLPEGAALSAGTDNGDGSWTLEPAELQGLTLTPPADFAGRFELAVTAVATDGADTALAAGTIAVAIAPVADAPSLSVAPAAGAEDQPIALEIQAAATDADGSETLSIAISGLPEGAALSAGTDNGDGSWTLDPAELQGLTLTPPAEFAGRFELTVETVAADGAAAPAVATAALAVEVTPVADAPSLTLADAAGSEDQPLALEIAAVSPDAVAVTIAGLPEGAALSAGTDNGDGSWTLEPAELQGLTLTPPADFAGRFELAVTAVATDGADTALAAGTIAVAIAPVADAPSLSVAPAAGAEDQPIALEIQAAATDADGSETLSIAISGLPEGAALSAGTDNGDGSWTLDPAELQGLTLTPPAEFAGRFELTVETVAADGAAAPAVATAALAVEVTPVADAPSLTLADAAGSEDQPLALEIAAVSPDAVAVTIAGLPEGAALSAGTDNGDGSWTLEPAELQGLTLTPPADFAGRFELAVTAVATDGADTALAAGTIAVAIAPVADAPSLSVAPAAGAEDQPIALEIQAAATDADGSETLSIAISGLPEGAALSAGTDNGDGSWTLDPAELQGLTLTPPAEFAGRFELTVETVAADGAAAPAVATAALAVEVTPVADAPSLTLADAAGSEDQPLALEIAAVSPDAVAVTIAGLPEGAALSAGTDNGDGSWTLEPAELQGLTLTPPADFAGRFELAVTAVATDGADTALAAGTIAVAIAPVADAPSLSVAPAAGAEDQPIALEIQAAATDADGSETLSIAISGLPEGAALSAGTDNGDGSWTLDPAELQGLTLTPPAEFAGRFELTVETVAADGAAAPAVATAALAVEVTPVADAPSLTLADAAGSEDQPLALEIAAVSPDAVAVTIAGLPEGAALSAGTDNGDGSWTLEPAELQGLTLTPPADFAGRFELAVTAVATDGADTALAAGTIAVAIAPVADAPSLSVAPAAGAEDQPIALEIQAAATDADGSETLSIAISGLPEGAALSAGTDNGDGSWTLDPAELQGLTLTPPAEFAGRFELTVETVAADGAAAPAVATAALAVEVTPVADAPSLTLADAAGSEDQPLALEIAAVSPDAVAVTIAGLPEGAALSAGTDNGDGSWTLEPAELQGLTLTPPADFAGRFELAVTAVATDGADTALAAGTIAVAIAPVADAPSLSVAPAAGAEDQPIALEIQAAATDADGSETLSIAISGLPEGAALSAGTDNGDGSWTLDPAELQGLTLTPPAEFAGRFELTVETVAADGAAAPAVATAALAVEVTPVADAPSLTLADAAGSEDQPLALEIAAVSPDAVAVTIAGLPEGAALSAGTDNGDGSWTLEPAELQGLTLTPPADFAGRFELAVTAVATDGADTALAAGTIAVAIAPVADAPSLSVAPAAGAEDQPIALEIQAAATDADGSETLSIAISGLPEGAALSAGTDNGDGSWTLDPAELQGLTLTPPAEFAGRFELTVETVAADGAAAPAVATAALAVEVTPVADAPSLTLADAAGSEDQPLALEIAAVSPDAVAVTIAGLPEGAALSAGTDNGDGSWTLEPAELQGLTLTPPADFAGRFELAVTAVATDGADTALAAGTIAVAIAPVADAPSLSVAPAAGAEDQPIALEIQAAATDADGSETLSIAISGLPEGAALSAGTDNGDGSWTLDPAELQGLTLTPPAEFAGRFELTVETVAADGAAAPAVATAALAVEVTPVADAPSLTLADAAGSEDQPLALEIAAVSPDAVAVTIAGLPEGAALSAGTDNGDGSWTLEPAELQGLTLTPPADFAGRFELAVTAVATDGADTALAAGTIAVAIAPVADAPSLSVAPAAGAEDQPIALEIQAAATDADGSETLSIAISGLPEGAALSAGTDNGDGSWTLDPAELQGLTLTPPAEFAGRFELTVETVAADGAAAPAVATAALAVEVTPVADAPSLTLADAAGSEDQPLALEIAAVSPDAVAVTIAGLPEGAALSAGTDNGDGSWTLEPAELQGLTLTPPADFAGRFELAVTAVATDGADTALAAGTIAVAIAPVADAPSLSVAPAAGAEDQPIALEIQAAATDADGSETLSIAISGLPEGAALSAGTDNGDGSWTLDPAELQGLTLTPPAEFAGRFELTVETVAADGAAAPAVATAALAVEVTPVADAPSLTLADAAGSEDQPLALEIAAVSPDAVAVTIAGLPEGAALSAGTDNGDGSWTLEPAELQGLTLTPPADFAGRFELAVTAVATDGADTALAAGTIAVAIAPVADAPSLSVAPAAGAEDQPIALEIQAAATDADGSETLSIAISGLPEGAALSAGTDNGDGSWTLDPAELQGLTLTPPAEFAGRFELTVETVAADGAAAPAVATAALAVEVTPVADAPSLTLADAAGSEDQPLALEIAAVSPDAVAVTIAGLPEGAALSAGTDNGDGSWTLEPAELQGLTLTPPADFAGRFELAVTAVATDGADTALAAGTIAVAIAPVADAPSLSVAPAAGAEDQPIALEIQAAATDADGSETLSIAISGLPEGAALSAGTDNGDGSWTLDPAELQGLTLTPPAEFAGRFELTVETVAADGAAAPAVATAALAVEVTPVADAPSLTLADAAGSEDQPLALEIAAVSPDAVAVTIAGLPEGAALSAGTDNGDGSWTLEPAELQGLTLTPPADFAGRFELAVTAVATDGADTALAAGTIAVAIAPVADAPSLSVAPAAGAEDQPIALEIQAAATDADGSETLSIAISGLPEGAALSAGTDNGDGSWTLDPAELQGLTLTPPAEFAGRFELTVETVAADGAAAPAVATAALAVEVTPVADAPSLTLALGEGAPGEGGAASRTISWKMGVRATPAHRVTTCSSSVAICS
ncbi:hypothetical protein G5B40_15395 [Pikeienuella piscinae]|uniref:Tandem-95 repeat protein n=1 Tax=Pikeienuella piscinae TaxID=2748098 RepID=A0A7L5BZZ2_9RHOB|nr:hypothetical protein [Pikeienuella piscinae]QIE56693.1 hypothetical protein G5B40_15395 [Pikeienuella piscinae]